MKKLRILLVNKNMIAGGIETSMLSFIENLKNIAEIDVMLFNKSGILIEKLPKDVNVYEGGFILNNKDNLTCDVASKLINFLKGGTEPDCLFDYLEYDLDGCDGLD